MLMTSDKCASGNRSGEGIGDDTWRGGSAVARTKIWDKIARLEVPHNFLMVLPLVSRKNPKISLFVPEIVFRQDVGM